jgi:hypothetical protein
MALLSRQVGTSRGEFLTARFPAEPNRYTDRAAAVTPGATALSNQEGTVEIAVVVSAVEVLAGMSVLRDIQRRCFEALRRLRGVSPVDRGWLTQSLHELRDLEVDLSFGVEAYTDMRLMVPSLPVEQLHRALVESLALERGIAVTSGVLARLGSALSAEDLALREDDETRAGLRRTAGALAAGLAAVVALPLAFLGVNATEVSASRSIFDVRDYWPYYAVLAGTIALPAAFWLLGTLRLRPRRRGA